MINSKQKNTTNQQNMFFGATRQISLPRYTGIESKTKKGGATQSKRPRRADFEITKMTIRFALIAQRAPFNDANTNDPTGTCFV